MTEEKKISETEERLNDLMELQKLARQIAKKDFFFTLMSPKVDDLIKALAEFKKDVPELKTDKTAGGRYKYQSFSSLLNAITADLAKHGCVIMQPVHTIGTITYIVTLILHSSGQYIRSVTSLPDKYIMAGKLTNTNENLQAMGGAITYTKRHALKSMLGIDADEDTDGNSPYASNGNRYASQ